MAIDWTKIYKKYRGMWVALADDEQTVLGSGTTLQEALQKAQKKGGNDPIVMRVPLEQTSYVGSYEV
jgi:hypothetical protein